MVVERGEMVVHRNWDSIKDFKQEIKKVRNMYNKLKMLNPKMAVKR